jgi:ribulose 1,5-bisphosphate carboxylase large subunit-like protein
MIEGYLFKPEVDHSEHIIATYYLESRDFLSAAKAIAIGQTIGNPDVRNERETTELMDKHLAKILDIKSDLTSKQKGFVKIAYPVVNFDIKEDGVTQLLCALMGGQMDIDIINTCRLADVEFPESVLKEFKGPKFGMENIISRAKAEHRPLLGGIIKPKTGISVAQLKDMVSDMLAGGVDFIKEDEILGNPAFCRFEERVKVIAELVNDYSESAGREVFYTPCINSDYPHFLERAKFADSVGMKAVHLNVWAGFPAYKALRDLDMKNTAIFFQKSGDKVITGAHHNFGIDWPVICKLARMMGADFIHAGMWGGYLSDSKEDLTKVMNILKGRGRYLATVPSLSCGSHPGLVSTTVKNFGTELMMNVGGAMQGHPHGTRAGATAMRQSFELVKNGGDIFKFMDAHPEFKAAIDKWGYVE